MAMKNRQLLALVLSGVLVISTLGGCSAFGQLEIGRASCRERV